MNIQINTLRLSVTTNCPLKCRYCFVKKTDKMMNIRVAKKATKLLLESPGKNKKLLIYGGEPMLNFSLLKEIIPFAKNLTKSLNKNLLISLATNGLLLNQNALKFFKQHKLKICISVDGDSSSHNQNRVFKNNKGSFDLIKKNLPLVFSNLNKRYISAIMIVSPKLVDKMYSNFLYLTKISFRNIEVESVIQPGPSSIYNSGISWNLSQKNIFQKNLKKIVKYIIRKISNNNFFFLNPLSNAINKLFQKENPENFICPFYNSLEVHPDGEMAFSPFLINLSIIKRKKYLIGNINKKFKKNYQNCCFDATKEKCQTCWERYYQNKNEFSRQGIDLIDYRDKLSEKVANYIYKQSQTKPIFKKYIKEAKKRIFE